MGVDERIDELRWPSLSFGVEIVESGLKAIEVDARRIFRIEDQRKVVGVIQPRHDDERFATNHPVLRNIRARQVTGPIDALVNEVFKGMLIDSMSRTDPTHGTLTGDRSQTVQSSFDQFFFLFCI